MLTVCFYFLTWGSWEIYDLVRAIFVVLELNFSFRWTRDGNAQLSWTSFTCPHGEFSYMLKKNKKY